MYPQTDATFRTIKQSDHTNLAKSLQRIESHFVIDVICKRIATEHPELPIFTIHDSIIATKGNESILIDAIESELQAIVGRAPKLKTELWEKEIKAAIAPKK